MSRPDKVLVSVKDLEMLRYFHEAHRSTHAQKWTLGYADHSAVAGAVDRLVAEIPAPEWEPTEEQVAAYCRALDWNTSNCSLDLAARHLKALHKEGLL